MVVMAVNRFYLKRKEKLYKFDIGKFYEITEEEYEKVKFLCQPVDWKVDLSEPEEVEKV